MEEVSEVWQGKAGIMCGCRRKAGAVILARMRLGKRPMLVGTVSSEARLRACARRAPAFCDWLEVRLDLVGPCGGEWLDLCARAQAKGRPVLLTIRDAREGGRWKGREEERLALVLEAVPQVAAVDMEIGAHALVTVAKAARMCRCQVVGSFHDYRGTPDVATLLAVEARGREMGADVVKVATRVRGAGDLARLMGVVAGARGPVCVVGMGARGGVSRVALPAAGSVMTFGALDGGTAPGQMGCRSLARELARWGVRELR